jgi:hypothetical protein
MRRLKSLWYAHLYGMRLTAWQLFLVRLWAWWTGRALAGFGWRWRKRVTLVPLTPFVFLLACWYVVVGFLLVYGVYIAAGLL